MAEKRSIGKFISDNKKGIIKVTIIVAGVVTGLVIVKLLANHNDGSVLEAIVDLSPEGLTQ